MNYDTKAPGTLFIDEYRGIVYNCNSRRGQRANMMTALNIGTYDMYEVQLVVHEHDEGLRVSYNELFFIDSLYQETRGYHIRYWHECE